MTYKPYGQYIDTEIEWIGLIPSSWKLLKSKFIFNRVNNQSTTGNEELLSVSEYYGVKPKKETINEGDFLSRSDSLVGYKKCSKNDLVMNIMLAWKKGLGVTNYDGIVSPAYEIFNINLLLAFPIYMNYLLRTDLYASEFKRHSYGVIDSRLRLYPDNFKEIECILPPLEEQKQIVNYLDQKTAKINATIAKNEELLDLLEEKRVALINQVVTKGLNPDVPMKDSGVEWIGDINEEFQLTRIKFCSEIYGRIGFRGYTVSDIVDEGEGAITLSPSNIDNQKFDLSDKKYLSWEKYEESPEIKIYNNDIIFVKTGSSVGKTCIIKDLDEKATLNPQLIVFKNIKINNDYLYYVLASDIVQHQVSLNLKGGTIPTLTQEDIQNYFIPLPNTKTQKQIVKYLDKETLKIDTIIAKVNDNINLLKEYKTSLIHHVVTGKIDVRGEEI